MREHLLYLYFFLSSFVTLTQGGPTPNKQTHLKLKKKRFSKRFSGSVREVYASSSEAPRFWRSKRRMKRASTLLYHASEFPGSDKKFRSALPAKLPRRFRTGCASGLGTGGGGTSCNIDYNPPFPTLLVLEQWQILLLPTLSFFHYVSKIQRAKCFTYDIFIWTNLHKHKCFWVFPQWIL